MEEKLGLADGRKLVRLARKSISYYSATGSLYREKPPGGKFLEKKGVFVTLNSFPSGELRGCIGLPYPTKELWNAVVEGAVSAAFNDPRFPPLKSSELGEITVEVSVLTEPKKIEKSGLPGNIKIGECGLIIERASQSGLLLPQVAVEYKWDAETFLNQACLKAGLFENAWTLEDTEVKTFSAQIFKEEEPEGKVVEEELSKE